MDVGLVEREGGGVLIDGQGFYSERYSDKKFVTITKKKRLKIENNFFQNNSEKSGTLLARDTHGNDPNFFRPNSGTRLTLGGGQVLGFGVGPELRTI